VRPIRDQVEERLAQASVGDDLGPFGERQVGCKDHGCLLGSLGDHLEEELGADLGQGNISNFIDGDEVVPAPTADNPSQLHLMFGLDQLVHQPCGRGESDTLLLSARGDTQAGEQMRLPGPALTDQHDGLGPLEIATLSQFLDSGG
jgi:hypothetical protein